MVSKQHTKISVDVETKELVAAIAKEQGRSMSGQIRHWANNDDTIAKIGTKVVTKPHINVAPTKPGKVNINVVD